MPRRLIAVTWIVTALGCSHPSPVAATPVPPPAPAPIPTALEMTAAPNRDELTAYVARVIGQPVPSSFAPGGFLERNEQRVSHFHSADGTWECVSRQTPDDQRVAVFHTSPRGFLLVPTAWLAKVISLPGTDAGDRDEWFRAMSRQLAATGQANGLARFFNGNAMAVHFELATVDDVDTELVASSRFMKAGQYYANTFGPAISGAQSMQTRNNRPHRGISVVDLLRELGPSPSGAKPISI